MNKLGKSNFCDLCKTNQLEYIYNPENSTRLLKVFICSDCGLVQSFPKIDHVKTRAITVSGGADWGNIRYGKGFRTAHNIDMINRVRPIDTMSNCIDIGSNRGNFLLEIKRLNSNIEIWGVEPDSNILENYSKLENFNIINDRVENVNLPKNYFDLVYCSHTIEHLKSPMDTLITIRSILKNDSIAYFEVPNIEFLQSNDTIEEWFIDKHLYHFSIKTFKNLVERAGFKILSSTSEGEDKINISMVVQPDTRLEKNSNITDYKNNKNLIKNYVKIRKSNIEHVKKIAKKLNIIAKQKRVVLWGAGRIFDILVKVGGLKVSLLAGVVDKYLSEFITETNDIEILKPTMFKSLDPEVVFISSREYFDEISEEIIDINRNIEILGFSNQIKDSRNG